MIEKGNKKDAERLYFCLVKGCNQVDMLSY